MMNRKASMASGFSSLVIGILTLTTLTPLSNIALPATAVKSLGAVAVPMTVEYRTDTVEARSPLRSITSAIWPTLSTTMVSAGNWMEIGWASTQFTEHNKVNPTNAPGPIARPPSLVAIGSLSRKSDAISSTRGSSAETKRVGGSWRRHRLGTASRSIRSAHFQPGMAIHHPFIVY